MNSPRLKQCKFVSAALLVLVLAPRAAVPAETWPSAVRAHYSLRYNGLEVGRLDINSTTSATTYSLSGSAKVSVFFGVFKMSGSSNVSGSIDEGETPSPVNYGFDWRQNNKFGTIRMAFKDHVPTEIAVKPPSKMKPDLVPLMPAHKVGAYDPLSAILMLTKADGRPPCDRRVAIFDGKQRYDIVLTPKRLMRLPGSQTAHVCRIMYEPVAGHRNNEDTRAYATNRDAEVVMRPIPGSQMVIPYAVTIPSTWGTGSMVTERIDIVTAGQQRTIALTD